MTPVFLPYWLKPIVASRKGTRETVAESVLKRSLRRDVKLLAPIAYNYLSVQGCHAQSPDISLPLLAACDSVVLLHTPLAIDFRSPPC